MLLDEKPYTFDRVIRIAIAGGILWASVWFLGYLSDVLFPFVLALLIAYQSSCCACAEKSAQKGPGCFYQSFYGIPWTVDPFLDLYSFDR